MSDEPTFVLLSQRLPANTLAHKFLGRIVENVKNPTFGYRPDDPSNLLTETPIEVSDTNASIYREEQKHSHAKGELGRLFGLSGTVTEEEKASLKAKTIVTRLLPQHRDAFKSVNNVHKDSIAEFLEENDGIGYMVVGLKTIFNGTMERALEKCRQLSGHVSLPVGTAVWAATKGAVNLGSKLDPELAGDRDVTAKWAAFSQIEDEQIFAVQYRVVELRGPAILCGLGKRKARVGGVMEFRHGVFGDDGQGKTQSKKILIEDDDEEDSGADEDNEPVLSETSLVDKEFRDLGLTFVN